LLSYWDFHAQPFLGFTKNGVKREKHPVPCLVDARGQRRMGRLIQADRRATLTEISPLVTTEVCSKAFVKPQS